MIRTRIPAILVAGLCHAGCSESPVSPPATDASCEGYCAAVQAACADGGPAEQYWTREDCEQLCEKAPWAPGTTDDTSGNGLGCRQHHAELAGAAEGADRDALCKIAGPSGADVCGSWCDVYCDYAEVFCTGPLSIVADRSECMAACSGFTAEPNGTLGHAESSYPYYDTVQCRIAHLVFAASDPSTHCRHAAPMPWPETCNDASLPNCAHYCYEADHYCAGADALYPSVEACTAACDSAVAGGLAVGNHADVSGDTLGCRINQAVYAATAEECQSASLTDSSVCQ